MDIICESPMLFRFFRLVIIMILTREKMKQLKSIITIGITLPFLTACLNNQPSFDPNNTEIRVIDSKSYNIPIGANPSPYVDAKVIKFYHKIGLSECKEGDITWEESNAVDEMSVAIQNGDKDIYGRLAKEGRIGCASPIQDNKK